MFYFCLGRQQTPDDTHLNMISPMTLMYVSLPDKNKISFTILSEKDKLDISSIMQKIKTQVSKILNKYLDLLLYRFRPLENQKQGFNTDLLQPNVPVLFRTKATGTNYGVHLFQLGLIQSATREGIRNSRNLFAKGAKTTKLNCTSFVSKM